MYADVTSITFGGLDNPLGSLWPWRCRAQVFRTVITGPGRAFFRCRKLDIPPVIDGYFHGSRRAAGVSSAGACRVRTVIDRSRSMHAMATASPAAAESVPALAGAPFR